MSFRKHFWFMLSDVSLRLQAMDSACLKGLFALRTTCFEKAYEGYPSPGNPQHPGFALVQGRIPVLGGFCALGGF